MNKKEKIKKNVPIKIEQFGRDHWSLLAYIEVRAVEEGGSLDKNHLRIKEEIDTAGRTYFGPKHEWNPDWGTRLKGFAIDKNYKEIDSSLRLPYHDDLDCFDDLEGAKLIENLGSGLNPAAKLTKKGIEIASKLREHKADGGNFSNFEI